MEDIKIYNTLDLPLRVFLNARCDGDFSQVENFDEIFSEYCEAIGGKDLLILLGMYKEAWTLKTKILLAQNMINQLKLTPMSDVQVQLREETFELLKGLNYHVQIAAPALDDIKKYCKQIEGYIKLDVVSLKEVEQEIKIKEKKGKKKGKDDDDGKLPSRNEYTDTILDINSTLNLNISEENTTRTFCRAYVKYKEHCIQLLKLQEKNRRK